MPDLQRYHALGNMVADTAASEVAHEHCVPASLNPQEPHPFPVCRLRVNDSWRLDAAAARPASFYGHSYWGTSLLECMLDWVSQFHLSSETADQQHVEVGVAWMGLVLSFMFFTHSYIPVHRLGTPTDQAFAWAKPSADALAFGYCWNECVHSLLPCLAKWSLCVVSQFCHSTFTVLGFAHCIVKELALVSLDSRIGPLFLIRIRWQRWSAMPSRSHSTLCLQLVKLELSQEAVGHFTWSPPVGSWNVLQKKLKAAIGLLERPVRPCFDLLHCHPPHGLPALGSLLCA